MQVGGGVATMQRSVAFLNCFGTVLVLMCFTASPVSTCNQCMQVSVIRPAAREHPTQPGPEAERLGAMVVDSGASLRSCLSDCATTLGASVKD